MAKIAKAGAPQAKSPILLTMHYFLQAMGLILLLLNLDEAQEAGLLKSQQKVRK
jgi:hypothetical protein